MFSRAHFQHFIDIVPYFGPLQGVMLCKNCLKMLKSTFLACFDLIMSERLFITLFYDIFLVEHIFNIFCPFVIRGGAGRGTIARRTCSYRNYIYGLLLYLPSESSEKNLFGPFLTKKCPFLTKNDFK